MGLSITRLVEDSFVVERQLLKDRRRTAFEERAQEAVRPVQRERREIFGFPCIDSRTAALADALQAIAERGARVGRESTWVLFNRVMDLYVWCYAEAKGE